MRKNLYTATIKVLKSLRWLVVNEGHVIMSDGHYLLKVTKNFYDAFFAGKAKTLPLITGDNVAYEYRDKQIIELENAPKFDTLINEVKNYNSWTCTKSPLMLEYKTDKLYMNTFFFNDGGTANGACFNSLYIDMCMEFSDKIQITGAKNPAYINNENYDIFVLVLPINAGSDFEELLKNMNAEQEYKKRIKELEKLNGKLERLLFNHSDEVETIKARYRRGLITHDEMIKGLTEIA